MSTLDRIQSYLGNGGLFNPEMMEHEKVRDLIMDAQKELESLRQENSRLREALKKIDVLCSDEDTNPDQLLERISHIGERALRTAPKS